MNITVDHILPVSTPLYFQPFFFCSAGNYSEVFQSQKWGEVWINRDSYGSYESLVRDIWIIWISIETSYGYGFFFPYQIFFNLKNALGGTALLRLLVLLLFLWLNIWGKQAQVDTTERIMHLTECPGRTGLIFAVARRGHGWDPEVVLYHLR